MTIKSIISQGFDNRKSRGFWGEYFLPIGLPLLLGLGLGPLLAALVIREDWTTLVALAIPFLIPIAILVHRYPFAAIVIWMAVMPWFPFIGIYKYVYFTVHRMLIPLALGLVILFRMLKPRKYPPVRLELAELATVAFGAMGIISIFFTGIDWKYIFVLQDQFLIPFMAYWLLRLSNAQERDAKRLIPLMLLLSLVEGVIGLVSWFAPQVLPSIWDFQALGDRTAGTFRQPAVYTCILLLFIVWFYHDAMNRNKGRMRTVQILVFALGLVCIFFTFTRGAWLTGIVVLLGVLFLYPRPTLPLIAIILSIMIILSSGGLTDEFAHAYERLTTVDEGAEARLVLADAGKRMFYARPVFGWGFSNYDLYDWKFLERVGETNPTEWQIRYGTSHHTYLTILAEMGVVGFFFYTLPIIWWLALSVKALPGLPKEGFWSRRWLIAMWLPMVAHMIIAQDLDMRFFYYALTLFWINLGFIANLVQSSLHSEYYS